MIALRFAPFALLFVLAASTEAGVIDHAVKYAEKLADEFRDKMVQAKAETDSAKPKVMEAFAASRTKLVQSSQDLLEQAYNDAYDKGCKPEMFQELTTVKDWIDDRFNNCIEISRVVVKMEEWSYRIYQDLEKIETGICGSVRNITLCSGKNIFYEIECVSGASLAFVKYISDQTTFMINEVLSFDDLIKQITTAFEECIFGTTSSAKDKIAQLFVDHC